MAFVERDQEIQTLPTKTATETFAEGIRRRRPHRRAENPHSEPGDRLVEFLGKDAVPVVEHESVRMAAGQSLPELNPDNPKFKAAISAWQRLPLPVANLIGPHIVKYLP